MIEKLTKEHEGATLIFAPTGTRARRDKPLSEQLSSVQVVKVARKWVTVRRNQYEETIHPVTGCEQRSYRAGYRGNAGYMFFADRDSFDAWDRTRAKRDAIENLFRQSRPTQNLNEDELDQILDILAKARAR